MGWALLRLGRDADAISAFERQRELGFAPSIATYNIACGHAKLGHVNDALDVLAALASEYDGGTLSEEFILDDPDLAILHSNARFKEIAALFGSHKKNYDEKHTDVYDKKDKDKPMQ